MPDDMTPQERIELAMAKAAEDELERIRRRAEQAAENEAKRLERLAERQERKAVWQEAHSQELEERRLAREAEREEHRAANASDRSGRLTSDDAFDLQMAPKMGIETDGRPVADILADVKVWRAKRQEMMRQTALLGSITEQTAKAPRPRLVPDDSD